MVRVVMAENEAVPTVGRIPGHDANATRPRKRGDDALRRVDSVMGDDDVGRNPVE
jgi:hypothetical protein